VIDSSELTGHAWLRPGSVGEEEELWSSSYETLLYRYQFDEPFTDVAGLLSLDPLPDSGGTSYLYWLSALVVLASTLGLLALYRMVAVRVGFAERQQNFVSAVTHELKTPLTAIRLYGEMLRDGLVPNETKRRQYFEVITAESERLTRLVNNVLELAKLQRKKRGVSPVAGPIEPVLREVVDVLEPHAKNEGFEIRIEVPPDLPDALFDRDALQQVFFNLLDNAIKYSKNGPRRLVLIEAERRDGGVSVAIVDHGPGVKERHLGRVFEPFFRGESELTRTAKGTGIGLALVRGLVESMGGTVTGENLAGGGFKVRVSLPLASIPGAPDRT
jgi:signal transduction histidine kinase